MEPRNYPPTPEEVLLRSLMVRWRAVPMVPLYTPANLLEEIDAAIGVESSSDRDTCEQ